MDATTLTTPEEARVLYVALTRARDETLMVERPDASFAVKKRAGRWIAAPWRGDRLLRVEVRVGDIDRAAPFTEDGSSAYIQRHLRTRVSPGDAVILERQGAPRVHADVCRHARGPVDCIDDELTSPRLWIDSASPRGRSATCTSES